MPRSFNIGARLLEEQATDCDWQGCPAGHDHRITYPLEEDGETETKRPLGGTCPHPSSIYKQIGTLIFFNANNRLQPRSSHYITDYFYHRHHVIPAELFVNDIIPNIQHNLNLLGWDMNDGNLNGMGLPYHHRSTGWHGLQVHRGGHDIYTQRVNASLGPLEGLCAGFCNHTRQDELLSEISAHVDNWKRRIEEWKIIIHSNTVDETIIALGSTEASIALGSINISPQKIV